MELVKYNAACRAVAEAISVDELKQIRDLNKAAAKAAEIAKDRQMELDALEIRARAERRLGEIIREQKETVGLAKAGRPPKIGLPKNPISDTPTLSEAGIDKNLAHVARKIRKIVRGRI